ncbi:hypothetical protein [Thermotoga sp.]|uniref:hypothetical protein n=1 Tax=Thermotoga sp. TaxID=28240 RepID=UPI0025CDDC5D|nr:hypothetical protein [Thermotoga sp.]
MPKREGASKITQGSIGDGTSGNSSKTLIKLIYFYFFKIIPHLSKLSGRKRSEVGIISMLVVINEVLSQRNYPDFQRLFHPFLCS